MLRRARRDGHLPHLVLRRLAAPRRVRRLLPPAPRRRGVGGLRLGVAHLVRCEGRPAHPPDAPLGGARVRGRHRPAPRPGLLHRGVPPAPRAQLDRRVVAAAARPRRRLHRVLAAGRSAVGHRPADHQCHRAGDPLRRRARGLPAVRGRMAGPGHHRALVPGAHHADPGADLRPARRPPRPGVAPEAHPVRRAAADQHQRRRGAGVAGVPR